MHADRQHGCRPPAVGDSPEARTGTLALGPHPHLLPLFDSGDAGGFLYYVMPYKEGQSLREKLARQLSGAIVRPDQIRFTDALPKARSGKIMRSLLRDIAP